VCFKGGRLFPSPNVNPLVHWFCRVLYSKCLAAFQKGRIQQNIPSTTDGIQREQEIQPAPDNHLIPEEDSYYFEETNTFPLPIRPVNACNAAQPVHRDLAMVLAKKISMQRTMTKLKSKGRAKHAAYKTKHHRATGVAARVHRLQHNATMETKDPITLANPFSEVLKARHSIHPTFLTS